MCHISCYNVDITKCVPFSEEAAIYKNEDGGNNAVREGHVMPEYIHDAVSVMAHFLNAMYQSPASVIVCIICFFSMAFSSSTHAFKNFFTWKGRNRSVGHFINLKPLN